MLLSSLFVSIGQLFWKLSNGTKLAFIFIGFIIYIIGAITMLIAFRFGSLSVLHPILTISYILAFIFGVVILKETMDYLRVLGILTVIIGVVFIGIGDD